MPKICIFYFRYFAHHMFFNFLHFKISIQPRCTLVYRADNFCRKLLGKVPETTRIFQFFGRDFFLSALKIENEYIIKKTAARCCL